VVPDDRKAEHMSFDRLLTPAQIQGLEWSLTDLERGVGTWRLALFTVLSKTEEELVDAAKQDRNATAMSQVLEATRDTILRHQSALELLHAAEARLVTVLRRSDGPPSAGDRMLGNHRAEVPSE
jgi:hypothetical protein